MHNLKKTYDSVWKTVAQPGGRGDIWPQVQHLRAKSEFGMSSNNYECPMSAHANNYDL